MNNINMLDFTSNTFAHIRKHKMEEKKQLTLKRY